MLRVCPEMHLRASELRRPIERRRGRQRGHGNGRRQGHRGAGPASSSRPAVRDVPIVTVVDKLDRGDATRRPAG
jgi:hypothetical protein